VVSGPAVSAGVNPGLVLEGKAAALLLPLAVQARNIPLNAGWVIAAR
jgi:hypothetical protein